MKVDREFWRQALLRLAEFGGGVLTFLGLLYLWKHWTLFPAALFFLVAMCGVWWMPRLSRFGRNLSSWMAFAVIFSLFWWLNGMWTPF